MKIASSNHRITFGIILGSSGLAMLFASCTDSYRPDLSGSASANSGGASGSMNSGGGDGISTNSGTCYTDCSNDLKTVIDCRGQIQKTCTADEGCFDSKCIANPCEAAEKSKSSYGCDYWALKTAQRSQADGACFAAVVANTWEKPVHLTVSYGAQMLDHKVKPFAYIPKANGQAIDYQPYDADQGLPVGEVAILFLSRAFGGLVACPKPEALSIEAGVKGNAGLGTAFHITTDYPVVAYQIAPFGGGLTSYASATLLLPTSAWDTNYIAINAYKASADQFDAAFPSMNVLAYQDGTEVTILPKSDILGGGGVEAAMANVPKKYTLNAGQFLQITQPAELTGSPIQSNVDHPVALFGASTCMFVPDNAQKDCDSGQQQIAPVQALGNEYVAIRYKNRIAGMEEVPPWRLVGAANDTTLTWEPSKPAGAPETLKSGDVAEFSATGPFVVKSQDTNHPFYLGGYMTGGLAYNRAGDPEWINITPPVQYLNRYVFFTDPTYSETSLTVVRTSSKVDGSFAEVKMDCLPGGKIPDADWTPIGKYQYARVTLVTGNFQGVGNCTNGRQEMQSALPFGVNVWGWGTINGTFDVSYAYPAGAGFRPINQVVIPPTPK